jgi:hypothetical protein
LVDDDVNVLHRRQIALEAEGVSVAPYTFAKLNALASKGALFLQHLKDEAHILRDEGHRFRSLLKSFRPKCDYASELIENAKLANLTATWPRTASGALWATDVLYVAVRNHGILSLAGRGLYVFSYPRVLQAMSSEHMISEGDRDDLLKLRWSKFVYRSRDHGAISLMTAEETVQRAINARPSPLFPERSIGVEPGAALVLSQAIEGSRPTYYRLRNLERAYRALEAIDPRIAGTLKFQVLLRWVEDPRRYASLGAKFEQSLIDEMKNIGSSARLSVAA